MPATDTPPTAPAADTAAPADTGAEADTDAAPTCAACPHPWENHDPIAARYCSATIAGKREHRGCVCAGAKAVAPRGPR